MGKKPKSKPPAAPVGQGLEKRETRFQRWQLIVAVAVALIALIPFFWDKIFEKDPPRFKLNSAYFRPDADILIFPENSSSQKRQPLDVLFDGYEFSGELNPDSEEIQWRFALKQRGHSPLLAEDGPHKMHFGFDGVFSDSVRIDFDSKAPQTRIGISGVAAGNKTFYGEVVDGADSEDKKISVELSFKHQEQLQTIQVPVRRITDARGQTFYEFEYQVQNLPRYHKDDPNYKAPYFALLVRDEAGNAYRQAATYNAFIAEGEQAFGFESGEITLQKITGDVPAIAVAAAPPKITDLPLEHNLAAGEPLIILRVIIRTRNFVKLTWNRLPDELRPAQEEYTILRENKAIATSFDTTFTDTAPPAAKTQYQVLARGNDNLYYPSTPAVAGEDTLSPDRPQERGFLTREAVERMIKANGIFDKNSNPSGSGIQHQYREIKRQGADLVIDDATGLTWQKGGSEKVMAYTDAVKYIRNLNDKRFAGHIDWRLPTLEEAMSLIEPKQYGNLYIDPVFDRKQRWIWTLDKFSASSAWRVSFDLGGCFNLALRSIYVRAVR